jgi:HK97 family phage major capsid protein
MKIKYLAGKLKDKVEDLDQVKAAELIDGGYAIEVNEPNPIDIAVEAMSEKISYIASKAAEKAANATLEKISKGLKSKPTISVGQDGWETDPAAGFKGVGDYLSSVIKMGQGKGVDERILKYNQKVTFSPMSDSTDGSIVPVEYSDQLINDIITENDFLEDCFKVPVTVGNSISVPCDNTTSLAAGGGVAAVVVGEGTQIQDSIASTRNVVFTLKKLATLIDVTEELLADTNIALPAY